MQHRPGGLVRADLERPLEIERRDAVLGAGEGPAGSEPDGERRPRSVEDRARGHRRSVSTRRAHPAAVAGVPASGGATERTDESIRPPEPLEVVQTGVVRREPRLELTERPWILQPGPRVVHTTSTLLRLNGEPRQRTSPASRYISDDSGAGTHRSPAGVGQLCQP